MGQTESGRFDRLSPRMRECLRLAYDRKTNKQIALALGVEEGTIKGYVAEAVRVLGARGKVDAAELLHAHEAAHPPIVQGPSGGVSAGARPGSATAPPDPPWWRTLPLRHSGASPNDLSISHRLVWIVLIAFGIALGIGAVADAVRVVDDIVRR